jgi:hypothetical protein
VVLSQVGLFGMQDLAVRAGNMTTRRGRVFLSIPRFEKGDEDLSCLADPGRMASARRRVRSAEPTITFSFANPRDAAL